jgi:hypothetical protein
MYSESASAQSRYLSGGRGISWPGQNCGTEITLVIGIVVTSPANFNVSLLVFNILAETVPKHPYIDETSGDVDLPIPSQKVH